MRSLIPVTIVLFSISIGCSKPDPEGGTVGTSVAIKQSQDEQLEKLRQESAVQEAKLKDLAEQLELQKAKDLEEQRAQEIQAKNEAERLKRLQESKEEAAKQEKLLERKRLRNTRVNEIFAYQKPEFQTRIKDALALLEEGKEITTVDRELIQQMNLVVDKLVDKVPFDDSDRKYLTEIGLEWWGTPEATSLYAGLREIKSQRTSDPFIRDVKMISETFGYSWDETAAYGKWYLRQLLTDKYTHNPNKMVSIHECIKSEMDITPWLEYSKKNPFVTDIVKQYHDRMRDPEFAAIVAKNELEARNKKVEIQRKKIETIELEKAERSKNIASINKKSKPLEQQINRMQNVDSKRGIQKLEELQAQLNKLLEERKIEIVAIEQLDKTLESLTSEEIPK